MSDLINVEHQLPTQATDDARDAARYRWLREKPERVLDVYMEWEGWQAEFRTPQIFDEDVDRAMASHK